MTRAALLAPLPLLLALAAPCLAQSRAGVYAVSGHDPARGAYAGQVELRWTGGGYHFIRQIVFQTLTYKGRKVSTVWTGRAQDASGGGVTVTLSLDRMGWVSGGPGLPSRTAADGVPMAIRGQFVPAGATLSGQYHGQGPPFADPQERWTYQYPSAQTPIWRSERRLVPAHRAPTFLEHMILFAIFKQYRQTPWVRPYAQRPELQAGIHYVVEDRTDFALLRRRPTLLRVIGETVDPLNLEEARVKDDAFGKTLREKEEEADRAIPARYLDPSGALARRDANGLVPDGDGALWTGAYAYSQALRYQVTRSAAALDALRRTVGALRVQMVISGHPDVFARTLHTRNGGAPLGGNWKLGQGPYAGLEWLDGGNNDMWKGLVWGGLAAYEGLPAGDPLRAQYGRALSALSTHCPVATSKKLGFLPSLNQRDGLGVAGILLGPGPEQTQYRHMARNPFSLLADLVIAGGLTYQGIGDWSGIHMSTAGLVLNARVAAAMHEQVASLVERLALRRAAETLGRYGLGFPVMAGAALGKVAGFTPVDPTWGIDRLEELPVPRHALYEHTALRRDWCLSPYPNVPWKFDWTQSSGRSYGLVIPPLFERDLGNYVWAAVPYLSLDERKSAGEGDNPADYLIAYWLGRANGVIGPND